MFDASLEDRYAAQAARRSSGMRRLLPPSNSHLCCTNAVELHIFDWAAAIVVPTVAVIIIIILPKHV
jgi:hypothetical protein